jgi:hypothetical protein
MAIVARHSCLEGEEQVEFAACFDGHHPYWHLRKWELEQGQLVLTGEVVLDKQQLYWLEARLRELRIGTNVVSPIEDRGASRLPS